MAERLVHQVGDSASTEAVAVPIVPMPDLVTYVCGEPGCEAVFTDPEPFEAHGQYLDHMADHDDPDPDSAEPSDPDGRIE